MLATSHNDLARLLASAGNASEAGAEYRTALAIQRKLADDHPADSEFQSDLAISHNNLGNLLSEADKAVGGGGRVPHGAGHPAEAGQATIPPSPSSAATSRNSHNNLGILQSEAGKASGGGGRAPQRAGHLAEAGRRQPRRHVLQGRIGQRHGGPGHGPPGPGPRRRARTAAEQAVVLLEALLEHDHASQWCAVLGEALLRRGQARLAVGDPAGLGGRLAARGGDL